MHEKFKAKLDRDILLDEMEQSAKEINGILKTIYLLEDYCSKHSEILEINNMTYIIEKIKLELYCLDNELSGIVERQKYNKQDPFDYLKLLTNDETTYDD